MTEIYLAKPTSPALPACEQCGGVTRIYGIEPHPRLAQTDVHTYVCDACDTNQVLVVPLPLTLGVGAA